MTNEEQIIFDRLKEDLMERNFGVNINFNSLRNAITATVAKEICNLAIAARDTNNEIIKKMNKILEAMAKINQRIYALENKQPTYVSPPVYGPPTKHICPQCGEWINTMFHICRSHDVILDNQTQEKT